MAHPMESEGSAHALLARNLPLISRSMTFAKMVKANARAIPNFKDLCWLFPPLCRRKDQAALTALPKAGRAGARDAFDHAHEVFA